MIEISDNKPNIYFNVINELYINSNYCFSLRISFPIILKNRIEYILFLVYLYLF